MLLMNGIIVKISSFVLETSRAPTRTLKAPQTPLSEAVLDHAADVPLGKSFPPDLETTTPILCNIILIKVLCMNARVFHLSHVTVPTKSYMKVPLQNSKHLQKL